MPRIAGINIPENKRIEYALTYIFGIGLASSRVILKTAGIDTGKKANDLTADETNRVQAMIEKNFKIEGDLRREITENIRHLKETGSWRGTRHIKKLPQHGRTRVNSRVLRGHTRKTMGSGKKAPPSPK